MQSRSVAKSVPGTTAAIEVRSQAPFAVGVVLWRDESSRVLATVVAKATYALAQGTSEIAPSPDPIRHPDEYWDDGAAESLRFPSDLAPFKPAQEVLVVGHVYADGNRPTKAATARIVVGDIEKMVEATTSRRTDRHGRLEVGPEQSRFSLRYEFAAGSADNPVGIDPTDYAADGGRVLPQLAPPNLDIRPGDTVPLMGFGPVSRSWPQRDALLRMEDREWLLDPLHRPRPRGFDPRYFCAAPADQRTAEALRADARVILEGLSPSHARLVTNLPGTTPALRSVGRKRQLPRFVADTLYVDTDRQIATLTFRATVPLENDKMVLDLVASGPDEEETDGAGEATAELDRRAVNAPPSSPGDEGTAELDRSAFLGAASTGLPFAPSSDPGRPSQSNGALSNNADGALPFRSQTQHPPSSRPLPQAPPRSAPGSPAPPPPASLPPPPPMVLAPPKEAPSFGLSKISSDEQRAPEAAQKNGPDALRNELGDRFRKAFGLPAEPAAPRPLATLSAPPPSVPPMPPRPATDVESPAVLPGSVRAASDAAAAAAVASEVHALTTGASPLGRRREAELGTPPVARRAIVDLLAFDPGVPSRLRRSTTYAPLLAVVPPPRIHQKLDAPAGEQTPEDRARVDILRVLSCGTPLAPEEINASFEALLDDPYDFDIPLFLVEGDVKPTMDEVETLRVAVELVKPIAGTSKRVQAALAAATEALSRTAAPVPESAVTLYRQLEASTSELSLPARHLADLVERTLREARSFKKRTLLGAPRIRADLTIGKITLPLYLPESAASQLPLLPSFPLAALVELRPREDASEQNAAALVALSLGRVLRSRK
jgi:hypothetical protein